MRLLSLLVALLLGCSRNPAPPSSTTPAEKLPPEVTGAPEDALPKKR
jgi:hypothetical protein